MAGEQNVPTPAPPGVVCPRCGSPRLQEYTIVYADGPVPSYICRECGYLDLQQLPTYISPKSTTKVDNRSRRLPAGAVLGIGRQAGVVDIESTGGTTAFTIPERT